MKIKKHKFIIAVVVTITFLIPVSIFSQELTVKASFQGIPINTWTNYNDSDPGIALDFNRDGVPDRPFIDSRNESLVILSGSSKEKWIVPLGHYFDGKFGPETETIAGFYEMDGDTSTIEIVIGDQEGNRFWSPVILSLNKATTKLQGNNMLAQPNYILLGINDIDQDGKDDIIIADTTGQMIEVLSYQ